MGLRGGLVKLIGYRHYLPAMSEDSFTIENLITLDVFWMMGGR
jgi:hypothetical protein